MADDENEDRRKVLAKLGELLAQSQVTTRPVDPAYGTANDRFARDHRARAEILAQAIELATPVLEATMRRVIDECLQGAQIDWSPPKSQWLEQNGLGVASTQTTLLAKSYQLFYDSLFLLEDGRLGWATVMTDNRDGKPYVTILRAALLEPADALRRWELTDVLFGMDEALGCVQSPEGIARREQFRALIVRAGEALLGSIEGLEAAVRPV